MGEHHACNLQDPFSPAMITENVYKCGSIQYKSKYVKMYFIKTKYNVSKCTDDYCRHELAILRARNPELASLVVRQLLLRWRI